MTTFSDEVKCKEFVSKDAVKAKASESQYPELSEEERSKLQIRQDLKDRIQFKNKLFVKHLIGEPDEIQYVNNVHEDWIYRRPVSVYELGYAPDKEIRIRFQKGIVQKVNHKAPNKPTN
ncbi:hypothetical protein AB3N61_09975 [Leptospira sp. WS58.C1]|uniref:hypothetical protein n=1 Tax=Leptospira TaxID=171 RepID=UPI00034D4CA1|nr:MULTISPECIES: hypothetical protein [unclassified Leptospira]MCR1792587.1 hypothetical protein [Leptospira sp. id769339]